MLEMNDNKQDNKKPNSMRAVIFIFGSCLSIFMLCSISNNISATSRFLLESGQQLVERDMELQKPVGEITTLENGRKFKAHHNFIVSYLFQESSFERINKNAETQSDFVSNIKQIHQLVFKNFTGIL